MGQRARNNHQGDSNQQIHISVRFKLQWPWYLLIDTCTMGYMDSSSVRILFLFNPLTLQKYSSVLETNQIKLGFPDVSKNTLFFRLNFFPET